MRCKRKDGQETRSNLLDAGAKVFAEKGFRAATIVDICSLAGANVASVNYYFNGKEELYVRSWRRSFELSLEKYPVDGGVPESAAAEERLRGHIRAIVARCLDSESLDFDIAYQEMAAPTGLLDEIMHESIQPLRETTIRLVRELMGEEADELHVRLLPFEHYFSVSRPRYTNAGQGKSREERFVPREEMIREIDAGAYADHVFEFSLAGIRRIAASSKEKDGK